mgnify:CR=1 FL=1
MCKRKRVNSPVVSRPTVKNSTSDISLICPPHLDQVIENRDQKKEKKLPLSIHTSVGSSQPVPSIVVNPESVRSTETLTFPQVPMIPISRTQPTIRPVLSRPVAVRSITQNPPSVVMTPYIGSSLPKSSTVSSVLYPSIAKLNEKETGFPHGFKLYTAIVNNSVKVTDFFVPNLTPDEYRQRELFDSTLLILRERHTL